MLLIKLTRTKILICYHSDICKRVITQINADFFYKKAYDNRMCVHNTAHIVFSSSKTEWIMLILFITDETVIKETHEAY